MIFGIQFQTFKADGELYSSRFVFCKSYSEAKKRAIALFKSSPHIASVIATDKETGKVIKRCPDKRGGHRENGGIKTFDGMQRPYRQTIRFAPDVWQYITAFPDKSEVIHRAVREWMKTHPAE